MCRRILACLAVALVLPIGAAGRTNDRRAGQEADRDIDAGYRTWKQDLEKDNLDDAVITSAERTIKVRTSCDFDEAIDVLKGRFARVRRQPGGHGPAPARSDVELRNRRQSQTRSSVCRPWGEAEALVRAYELSWPVESMTVHAVRLNDGELAGKVEQMEKSASSCRARRSSRKGQQVDRPRRRAGR
jgi:hypothetical protein